MADEIITGEITQEKDWTVFAIGGRLDKMTAPQIEERAGSVLASCAKFAVDVKGLSYISSAGVRILFCLVKQARAEQKEFAICGVKGFVKKVLEDSNMHAIAAIYGERGELTTNS